MAPIGSYQIILEYSVLPSMLMRVLTTYTIFFVSGWLGTSTFHRQAQCGAKCPFFFVIAAALWKNAFSCLSNSVRMVSSLLSFISFFIHLNLWKWLVGWHLMILQVHGFGTNLHPILFPFRCLQTFSTVLIASKSFVAKEHVCTHQSIIFSYFFFPIKTKR